MAIASTLCGSCQKSEETGGHILVECPVAKEVLSAILHWCNIPVTDFQTVQNIIDFAIKWGNCPKRRKTLVTILFGVFWGLWRARNDRILNKIETEPVKIISIVKAQTFVWMKHRGGNNNLEWRVWNANPLLCN